SIIRNLRGGRTPAIPWACNFDYWLAYNRAAGTLPEKYRDLDPIGLARAIRTAAWRRTCSWSIVPHDPDSVKITNRTDGPLTTWKALTPGGMLTWRHRKPDDPLQSAFPVEYPVKSPDDLPAYLCMIQNERFEPDYAEVRAVIDAVGGDGVAIDRIRRAPIQHFMIEAAGWETGLLMLADAPAKVQAVLEAMEEHWLQMLKVSAGSPAKIIWAGDNMDSIIGPHLFRRWIVPWYARARKKLQSDQILSSHFDGRLRSIMHEIAATRLDAIEAVTPLPMGDVSFGELRDALGPGVAVQGGIPSCLLCGGSTRETLARHIRTLIRENRGRGGFVLGMGDNVPPDADFSLVEAVPDIMEEKERKERG
ncbi:MAG TPA: uroporphyrinogen decarboxylase family protein, partial [Planctomycetota bacterium]|nr:uroporphyrinogen decarboxylase family protein [Planctomycetota bacterium]